MVEPRRRLQNGPRLTCNSIASGDDIRCSRGPCSAACCICSRQKLAQNFPAAAAKGASVADGRDVLAARPIASEGQAETCSERNCLISCVLDAGAGSGGSVT